jgi:hypothetical protein
VAAEAGATALSEFLLGSVSVVPEREAAAEALTALLVLVMAVMVE